MELHVFVEEPSAEAAMRLILPKIVRPGISSKILNFGCKSNLLRKLPLRLEAYAEMIRKGRPIRLIVTVDRDNEDCVKLKRRLEAACFQAGLSTLSNPDSEGRYVVANRLVIEELEAWFLGDAAALTSAFPKLKKMPVKKVANPDNVTGGTWEYLHKHLKKGGIYGRSYPKIEAARMIAQHMDVDNNRSPSFRAFRDAARKLVEPC